MIARWIAAGLLALLSLLLLSACQSPRQVRADQALHGRMLVWHAWSESETDALNQVIASFIELNPGVTVKQQRFADPADLRAQFSVAAAAGLGPDLLIAPATWLPELVAARALTPLDAYLTPDVIERYPPAMLTTLQVDGQTYGLPQALDTLAIYVNTSQVATPTNSLNGLLEQANAGTTILLPINFDDAFWGIQAFGGQLFNAEGQVILDQGGFANWLAWLRDSRNAPGMIQDTNRDALRQRFLSGDAAYYFGYASEVSAILTALDPAQISVLPLPAEPVGPAGPFVSSQALMVSRVSSQRQQLLAAELAKFITNSEQSARLMRLVRQVPANSRVRINPRLNPIVAAFAAQARSAVPLPTRPEFATVQRLGNEAYIRALEGGESPADVAFAVTNLINEANGFPPAPAPTYACTSLGTVLLAHSLTDDDDLTALDALIEQFQQVCPLVIVNTQAVNPATPATGIAQATRSGQRPTFAWVDQATFGALQTAANWPRPLTSLTPEMLQRYWPATVDALRVQGNLYGLPLSFNVDALYYNRDLVTAPAQSLDELRAQSSAIPITLDTRWQRVFWGIGAMGGAVVDADNRFPADPSALVAWLTWLADAQINAGIYLTDDPAEARSRFLSRESAYYIAGADELADLQAALGDALGVTLLPSGPGGPARPLLAVEGLVFRADAPENAFAIAQDFARFASEADSQATLLRIADRLPANATLGLEEEPLLAVFVEQAQSAWRIPNHPIWAQIEGALPAALDAVLNQGADPATVVADLAATLTAPLSSAPTADTLRDAPTPPGRTDNGSTD